MKKLLIGLFILLSVSAMAQQKFIINTGASYAAGYGLTLGSGTFKADTALLSTYARTRQLADSLSGLIGLKENALTFSSPLSRSVNTISMPAATTSVNGYLTSTDWNTFNGKYNLPSLTAGSVLFSNGTTIAQNNANFNWNNSTSRLSLLSTTEQLRLQYDVSSYVSTTVGANGSVTYDGTGSAPDFRFGKRVLINTTTIGAANGQNADLSLLTASGGNAFQISSTRIPSSLFTVWDNSAGGSGSNLSLNMMLKASDGLNLWTIDGRNMKFFASGSTTTYAGVADGYLQSLSGSNFTAYKSDLIDVSNTNNRFYVFNSSGSTVKMGINVSVPTAQLHLKAGTATANTAPLKFNTGVALTTPEDGAMEYHGTHLYFTIGSTRYQLDQQSAGGSGITSLGGQTGATQTFSKVDDTNVTLAISSATNNHAFTLGWAGTLADGRIASASAWNAKQAALSGTGIVKSTAGTISYLTDNTTNWDAAYSARISSLTTTGNSGAAILVSNTLNIPNYTLAGLGGIANGGGVVSYTAGTIASRPAAGTAGRFYIGTDTGLTYYDTGAAWVIVVGAFTGDVTKPLLSMATVVDGLKGSAVPTLATGNLRYNGSAWIFDNTSYLTANQNVTVTATGDAVGTSSSSPTAPSIALTLATVNSNVGSFGTATQTAQLTLDAKGRATAASNVTITPAVGSITGFGTGVATALAVNANSAGGFTTIDGTATLTNKSIAAGSNTITGITNTNLSGTAGITNANLANSSVTVNGSSVALGASTTITADPNITSLTLATPVAADEIPIYDASATAVRKVTVQSLNEGYQGDYMRTAGYSYFNEFIASLATASAGNDIQATNSGTGAGNTPTNSTERNRPGQLQFASGTTSTGRTAVNSGAGVVGFSGGKWIYETDINIAQLSTGTERFQLLFGFFDTYTTVNQIDGAYLLYDEGGVTTGSAASANWQLVTSNNSTRTFTTSSTAIAISTWTKLRIEVNAAGTSIDYFVNGSNIGTITTNIPTASGRVMGFGNLLIKSIGTTSVTYTGDFIFAQELFTTPR